MLEGLIELLDDFDGETELPSGERRRDERSRVIIDLFFDRTDATGVASTRDISCGGLYLNMQAVLPEGTSLTLRIPFGNDHLVVRAMVIYSNPGCGVGVRFKDLSERDRVVLESMSATTSATCLRTSSAPHMSHHVV